MPGVSAVNSWMYARREVEVRRSLSPNSNRHQREISVGDLAEPGCHHKAEYSGRSVRSLTSIALGTANLPSHAREPVNAKRPWTLSGSPWRTNLPKPPSLSGTTAIGLKQMLATPIAAASIRLRTHPAKVPTASNSDSALCASIHFGTVVALKPHRPKKILLAGGSRSYPAMRA